MIEDEKPDIIAVTETWFSSEIDNSEIQTEQYIEILWINIQPSISTSLLIGICYRPELAGQQCIEKICSSIDSVDSQDMILVGDFNFRDIQWNTGEATSRASQQFVSTLQDNFLTQMIREPTRDKYINDLLITAIKPSYKQQKLLQSSLLAITSP